jgi:hypothetical protein
MRRPRRLLTLLVAIIVAYSLFTVLTNNSSYRRSAAEEEPDSFDNGDKSRAPKNNRPAPVPDRPEDPGARNGRPHPKYKPSPTDKPSPIQDPFPLLAKSTPPPIPEWNRAKPDLHKKYDIAFAPPLLVGFGRNWPMLLQTVVSYITAGWPAEQIYVIENTGVQASNKKGKLSLQNPFYLNYDQLKKLGVNVVQAPVLMTFAQLQNFYIHLANEHDWPFYFWSHMDVLALSFEDGEDGRPKYNETGYMTIYELALKALKEAVDTDDQWGLRFFAYDHLALVNRKAYEDVGGWDVMIPFYIGDCDMHSRLTMAGWSQRDAKAGIVTDVALALDDLLALYRVPGLKPSFTDPSPPPPEKGKKKGGKKGRRDETKEDERTEEEKLQEAELLKADQLKDNEDPLEKWKALKKTADDMFHHKHGNTGPLGRNTWQQGQHGGVGEPYYYPNDGLHEAIEIITEAGRQVYAKKWGHRGCDLIDGAGLELWDQWKVKQDWN